MKNTIKTVEMYEIEMPYVHPFRTSFGEESHKQAIIIKITDAYSNVGWGETTVTNNPFYCSETVGTAWHITRDFLLPIIKKLQEDNPEFTIGDLYKEWELVRGHEIAKSGVEAALWALKAKQDNVSLGSLYGATKEKIPTGVSIGIQKNIDYLVDRIGTFIDKGYQRIKIKIEPGWEVEPVKRIRKEFGDILLMVDANSAFSLNEKDVNMLKQLDQYDLMMIEQPLQYHDIFDHKKLQDQLETPVCLDESIHSPHDARVALELGACKIINIKPGRVGGFAHAIEIAEMGGAGNVWCGGMLETGIGRLHNIFLQGRNEFTLPGDTSGSDRYYARDIIDPPVVVDDKGFIAVPDGMDLGVNEEILKGYTKRRLQISMV